MHPGGGYNLTFVCALDLRLHNFPRFLHFHPNFPHFQQPVVEMYVVGKQVLLLVEPDEVIWTVSGVVYAEVKWVLVLVEQEQVDVAAVRIGVA